MRADEDSAWQEIADIVDSSLYPDLVEHGGLVAALSHEASECGMDLGEIGPGGSSAASHLISAHLNSDRGPVFVRLGAQERWFSISIESSVRPWAAGGTDDLRTVVKALDAWRKGATLIELNARFPFLGYDELALAYENGDPVATQWDLLFRYEKRPIFREMLQAVHADAWLRTLFPYLSMGRFGLTRDHASRMGGGVRMAPLKGGGYCVEKYPSGERIEVESLGKVIGAAREFLDYP
ncbi:hypothetical protein [Streptomyces sp. NPDC057623]|uniref:hypothetical protein n=1 Tax=Streptomyces sp. NPDC057623 TaxID=3346187 RepID=UPI0036B35446